MFFPEDVRQDIKTFWGIPMAQLVKILIPLGFVLAIFLVWAPFPWGILGKTVFALALFFGMAIALALKLPRYYHIIKHYRNRIKVWIDRDSIPKPTQHKPKKKEGVGAIQDLIDIEGIHTLNNKVLLEWADGKVSLICHVQAEPIDFLPASQLQNIQEGIKSALAAAASNHLFLTFIEDSDFAYNESFWEDQKNRALANIVDLPKAIPVTMTRLEFYEGLIQGKYAHDPDIGTCVQSSGICRIDGDLAGLMREETGATDKERKERALLQFSYTTDDVMSAMSGANINLSSMDEFEIAHLLIREFAPWLRGSEDELEILKQLTGANQASGAKDPEDTLPGSLETSREEELGVPDREYPEDDLVQPVQSLEESSPPDPINQSVMRPITAPPLLHTRSANPSKIPFQTQGHGQTKVKNPFAKKQEEPTLLWSPIKQPRVEKVIPMLRTFPNHVVVLVGAKRYVGTTTVAVHLTQTDGVLANLGRGSQPASWPSDMQVIEINGDNRVMDIYRLASEYPFVVVDLGLLTEDCEDILRVASQVLYVMDNQVMGLELAKHHFELLQKNKVLLAIMKANPGGLSPGLLSARLGASIGLVIPFDQSYQEVFGLNGPVAPWEILRRMLNEQEVNAL